MTMPTKKAATQSRVAVRARLFSSSSGFMAAVYANPLPKHHLHP
jgi:hypothetical protein